MCTVRADITITTSTDGPPAGLSAREAATPQIYLARSETSTDAQDGNVEDTGASFPPA